MQIVIDVVETISALKLVEDPNQREKLFEKEIKLENKIIKLNPKF